MILLFHIRMFLKITSNNFWNKEAKHVRFVIVAFTEAQFEKAYQFRKRITSVLFVITLLVQEGIWTHIDSVHEQRKSHEYSFCRNTFARIAHLKIHVDSVHEKKKSHVCSICDYSSSRKDSLKIHIVSVHEKKKLHKCLIYDYSSAKNSNLKAHVGLDHEGKKATQMLHLWFYFCMQEYFKRAYFFSSWRKEIIYLLNLWPPLLQTKLLKNTC